MGDPVDDGDYVDDVAPNEELPEPADPATIPADEVDHA